MQFSQGAVKSTTANTRVSTTSHSSPRYQNQGNCINQEFPRYAIS
jgi:hypothetical protein